MIRVSGFLVCVALLTNGCAAQQSYDYSRPSEQNIENQAIISANFEETWDKLVKNLSADFFSINNIEKASRIINVSFSIQNPEEFVDCGVTRRNYKSPSGAKHSYTYNSERNAEYKTAASNGWPIHVVRRTDLEGRINIYVAPLGEQSEISVNARYVLNINLTYQGMNKYEVPVGAPVRDVIVVNFDTKKPSQFDGNKPACTSNGALEQRIIHAAN